jgi:esterase/lipase superfamily enzyme
MVTRMIGNAHRLMRNLMALGPLGRAIATSLVVAVSLLATSCTTQKQIGNMSAALPQDLPAGTTRMGEYLIVNTYYGTDRQSGVLKASMTDMQKAANKYGGLRSDPPRLEFGIAEVSIPKNHVEGELDMGPYWRRNDPAASLLLLKVRSKAVEEWQELLRKDFEQYEKAALIYVHGYNVDFRDAARRCAQLAYDLKFSGVPMFFSWPSRAVTTAYAVDEATVEWSTPHLVQFLRAAVSSTGAERVYIIAHSMGVRATIKALEMLDRTDPAFISKIKGVIFAAPDIDADVFALQILPAFRSLTQVTLYVSDDDEAIRASRFLHGYPRAGGVEKIAATPNIVTIDATGVDTSFMGHSYYASTRALLADIKEMISGVPPDKRAGIARSGTYWKFRDELIP